VGVFVFGVLLRVLIVVILFFERVDDEAQHVGYFTLQQLLVSEAADVDLPVMVNGEFIVGLLDFLDMLVDVFLH
jgi:hypothetical protein